MADEKKPSDTMSLAMLEDMATCGLETTWDRYESQLPQCGFGRSGLCCRHCNMGPCQVNPFGGEPRTGVCGADADTIVARGFLRTIAAGTSAHSDHGRAVCELVIATAKGEAPGYEIKDTKKLHSIALAMGIDPSGKSKEDLALAVGELALAEFGKPHGHQIMTQRAPKPRQELWRRLGITPRAIDREVVEAMHRTGMGVDQDYHSLLLHGQRVSLADGWGGSMLGTELQDILFGTPKPVLGEINLGVLKADKVNVIVHGHEPILSEMVALASQDPELLKEAEAVGAKGIVVAGICCTANELLIRHGIPVAGHMKMQELAIATGAVDAMVVDVQCIMQGDVALAAKFHTRCITTSPKARIRGATHIEFEEHHALDTAKKIVREAIAAFPKRDQARVKIPSEASPAIAGFSHEAIKYMLGGSFRASYRPLNENIINGRIRGVAGVVGCTQPKIAKGEQPYLELVKELVANDVLVVETGCAALECGRSGFLLPEFMEAAGPGLREVCETVGMPPVLHAGSCVDNSRILIACTEMVHEGGLGDDLSALPVAGACFEWMNEKAIAIGQYFVSSGAFVAFGITLPVYGSPNVVKYLTQDIEAETGGKWAFGLTPSGMAAAMIDHINAKRTALGIDKPGERVLYDMEARRQLKF
ncbi:MAG TPA: anaerobic carbon-monoxide dehydrogenase catalytic subunit [Planctomycetota bacterium]|nr:anaerobic carbon-monoxide dehydrogenase catalytic subunit [Planctomycetota bacterium]HRR81823.1 anaerobic carbon-monoxide dehydrogenase catalytic subunit [Planctomycetota bacterium]HRT96335.1 anaerobic carbon-monoxide dehydrogenase catalytic subunit [Planctomycetota bacterium]